MTVGIRISKITSKKISPPAVCISATMCSFQMETVHQLPAHRGYSKQMYN